MSALADLQARIEANADLFPWAVSIAGPDDLYAAQGYFDAVRIAEEINVMVHSAWKGPNDVTYIAYAAPWPYSRERHAAALKRQEQGEDDHDIDIKRIRESIAKGAQRARGEMR